MAASLSDILSALKNGVIAINGLISSYAANLLAQSALTTSYSILYTANTSSRVYVNDICVCNTTGAALSVYISLVPLNGTPGASNAIFYNASIPAYSTLQWTGTQVLNSGATIQAYASATGCTVNISGRAAT